MSWSMDYSHNKTVPVLNCQVLLPTDMKDNGEFTRKVFDTVLRYGFAIRYSEGNHAIEVREKDWKLIDSLVAEMTDEAGIDPKQRM